MTSLGFVGATALFAQSGGDADRAVERVGMVVGVVLFFVVVAVVLWQSRGKKK